MATILLSAAGAALGGSIGGSVLGLSAATLGRAAGATLGRVIDSKIFGSGSSVVEVGKVDRFRLTGAGEGVAIPVVQGRARVAGHVIWASRFLETVTTTGGGGKGAPSQPETQSYSYSVSLAIALCEGEIRRVGRVWADGVEVSPDALGMRFYTGREDQLPDPKIEAVEGAENAPAFRGLAYVVFEDLSLSRFGNRVPQFSFEVVRTGGQDLSDTVRAVALMPGSGEYALATTPVHFEPRPGVTRSANVNTASDKADLLASLDALEGELPRCEAVSLIVSWFGDDLRAGRCNVRPKVEQSAVDGAGQPWRVSGVTRGTAGTVSTLNGGPVYGGTPGDGSVLEALRELKSRGQRVLFYPFLLMEQLSGNQLTDPYSGLVGQPALPWRGRITTERAPGVDGSTDGSAAAEAEVAAFFGSAAPGDFSVSADRMDYIGPPDTGYRRFILHYAHLCALAGGVDAFCIGTEMRGLTQIRGTANSFPAVAAFRQLAADVRAILGPDVKLSYAADWSEYFGYHPQDGSGDVFFHLDPLWADPNIDFIGIDNYMPLSDWRDQPGEADADWGHIQNVDYLAANVQGGEGYDWYYASPEARARQDRTPITDGAYDEPWVFRYKDLKSWWSERHKHHP